MKESIMSQTENLKKAIVTTINDSNLPIDVIDNILHNLYNEVHTEIQNQLVKDMNDIRAKIKKLNEEVANIKSKEG